MPDEELWTEEELRRPPRSVEDTLKMRLKKIQEERDALKDQRAEDGAEAKRPGGDRAGEPFTEAEMKKRLAD